MCSLTAAAATADASLGRWESLESEWLAFTSLAQVRKLAKVERRFVCLHLGRCLDSVCATRLCVCVCAVFAATRTGGGTSTWSVFCGNTRGAFQFFCLRQSCTRTSDHLVPRRDMLLLAPITGPIYSSDIAQRALQYKDCVMSCDNQLVSDRRKGATELMRHFTAVKWCSIHTDTFARSLSLRRHRLCGVIIIILR